MSDDGNDTVPKTTKLDAVQVGVEGKILASGIDTLDLSLNVTWRNNNFFKLLNRLKADAAATKGRVPGVIEGEGESWVFNVRGHGSEGYAWLVESLEYDLKIVDSMRPTQRPSIFLKIHAIALWQTGVIESIDRFLKLILSQGCTLEKVMVSRVDLCVDILLREQIWDLDLRREHAISRARDYSNYGKHDLETGFNIGHGTIRARFYDKPVEIRTKSKKEWMYAVWGIEEAPAECRIIRAEFQLRREALIQLGIDTVWQLTNFVRNLWAYCTQSWLTFQDTNDVHHTQQETMPWWKTVQSGFLGMQGECPLIRARRVNTTREQIARQLLGHMTSLIALESEPDLSEGGRIDLEDHLEKITDCADLIEMDGYKLKKRVKRKIAKYWEDAQKFLAAEQLRKELGFPLMTLQDCEKDGAHSKKAKAAQLKGGQGK